MRTLTASAVFALALLGATAPAIAAGPAAPAVSAPKYSSAETEIGTLLDDPAARAILEKHIPGLTTNPQIEMARSMTLKSIQPFAAEDVTDARLAAIDAELAQLPG